MDKKIRKIVNELKENISNKYELQEMRLFGSTAREDRKKESDIDIFVRLLKVNQKIEEELFDMAYDLELKYGYSIDLFVFDNTINDGINAYIPVYRNIRKDGISV